MVRPVGYDPREPPQGSPMNAQDYFQLAQDFLDAVQSDEAGLKAYATDTWAKFRFHRSPAYYFGYCDGLVEVLTSVSFNRFEIEADP